jgi:hypothetical protein
MIFVLVYRVPGKFPANAARKLAFGAGAPSFGRVDHAEPDVYSCYVLTGHDAVS